MPCNQCDDGTWRWGDEGDCAYESQEECEAANDEDVDNVSAVKRRASVPWYRFVMQADDEPSADVYISDYIGDWVDDMWGMGVTAKSFIAELAALPSAVKTLRVHINSPGGDVFSAVTIANALRDQRVAHKRKVVTMVDGLAASAASIIAMAGAPVVMADNALLMIHNPWTTTSGTAEDLRKQADTLDQLTTTLVTTYQWHAELSDEEIVELMTAETWMDADEAIALGFADEKVEGLRAAATINPKHLARLGLRVPAKYADRVVASTPAGAPEAKPRGVMPACQVVTACREAGLDLSFTEELIAQGLGSEGVLAAIEAERVWRAEEAERCADIETMCAKFGLSSMVAGFVDGGITVAGARRTLSEVVALRDRAEIDAGFVEGGGNRDARAHSINTVEIFTQRAALGRR